MMRSEHVEMQWKTGDSRPFAAGLLSPGAPSPTAKSFFSSEEEGDPDWSEFCAWVS